MTLLVRVIQVPYFKLQMTTYYVRLIIRPKYVQKLIQRFSGISKNSYLKFVFPKFSSCSHYVCTSSNINNIVIKVTLLEFSFRS